MVATARVRLLTAGEGGRRSPILSGYRSLLRFDSTEVDFGFELELESGLERNGLDPGGSGNVKLSMWATEHLPTLSPGTAFEIREGHRVVGHGSVEAVVTPLGGEE